MTRRLLPALVLASLAAFGCADADHVALFVLAGERPGDQPLYGGTSPSIRLGATPPRVPDKLYRMPPPPGDPGPALSRLHHSASLARQALADRENEYDLRRRYLRLNTLEYAAIVAPLVPRIGTPLPANIAATQSRLGAVKQAQARIGADVVALSGILLRQQHAKSVAERVLAVARQSALAPAQPIALALRQAIEAADAMLKDGDKLLAEHVEWLTVQRAALDAVEAEIAQGPTAPPPGPARIFTRQTLFGRE